MNEEKKAIPYHPTDPHASSATLLTDIVDDCGGDVDELYDNMPTTDSQEYALHLNPRLTDAEAEDARFWYFYSRGLMLLTGMPGSGKGLIGDMILYKMRYYFDKNIILDYRPRRLFAQEYEVAGNEDGTPTYRMVREKHIKLFNTAFFMRELGKMAEVAMGEYADTLAKKKEADSVKDDIEALQAAEAEEAAAKLRKNATKVRELTGQWVSGQGQVFFKYAALGLEELKLYHDKRRPHNPTGLMLDDIYNIWRHLDFLLVGMSAYRDELDEVRFMPKVNYEIKCRWSKKYYMTSIGGLYRYMQVANSGVSSLGSTSRRIPLVVDGAKPRDVLAGKAWKDIYNSFNAHYVAPAKSMMG